ncbi:MAG: polysaccharide biosynthesis tyrosine autokinase [Clostridia bacterium]|nr:polysaccharide biosynthesis tyrosine autokinase [Clostridia bacterium]
MAYDKQERVNNGIDIDILAFLRVLVRKLWIVAVLALVCGIISTTVSMLVQEEIYSSKVSFVVDTVSGEKNEKVDNSDINASINVAATYSYILQSRSVINMIVNKCTLPVKYQDVKDALEVTIITGSNVIEVNISTNNAELSFAMAKALVENYAGIVSKIYSTATLNVCDFPAMAQRPDNGTAVFLGGAIGVAFGIIAGLVIILIYYIVTDTVRSVDDVARKIGINVLGSINKINNKSANMNITNKKIGFSFIETFKAIRTKVESNAAKEGNKVYMITSACESEGKTTISTNLAIALAQNGKSVLLIDSDLRRPRVCKALGVDHTGKGLAEAIAHKAPLESVIKYIDKYNLFVIADSQPTDNPSELLSTKKMAEIVKAVRNEFDFVIIDTAPASVVTDASVISSLADASILVISEDRAPAARIRMAINDIDANGAYVIGCVYNKATVASKRYASGSYGSYGSYGGYGGYGYGYGGYEYAYRNDEDEAEKNNN